MKNLIGSMFRRIHLAMATTVVLSFGLVSGSKAAPAPLLFNDEFGSVSGWTIVMPTPNYGGWTSGAEAWGYDQVSGSIFESSDVYTDSSVVSTTRKALMMINDTVPPTSGYEFKARLTMVDDDGCGLIFGYQAEDTYYRLEFSRQASRTTGWPWVGWNLDRMNAGAFTDLAGRGVGPVSFTPAVSVPFDITVGITNDHVTIRVVDNPDISPTPYDLVVDQVLPTTPSGKVGFFSWGMANTTAATTLYIPGWNAVNYSLSPTPLATINTGWTAEITPNSLGTTFGSVPIWARIMDHNGNGFLRDKSDVAVAADNVTTAARRIDFRASAYVGGDTTWSNYVMSSRFITRDDDGFGVFLRYVNNTNWLRVAFRAQSSTAGVKTGLSVQRCTNMVFNEIATAAAAVPALNLTYDLYCVVQTNQLTIHLVADPDNPIPGSRVASTFGPYTFVNSSLISTGKVGLFGWYQIVTDWDFVRVYSLTNAPLYVKSTYPGVSPAIGMNDLAIGGSVTAYAPDVSDAPGTRRRATGWWGSGDVSPTTGSGTNVTFTLNKMSSLEWFWKSQFQLTVSATPGGTVNFIGTQYLDDGTVTNLIATPNPGYIFMGWVGLPSASLSNGLSLTITRPLTVTAKFSADSDGDGLADDWEIANFGNLAQTAAGDPDGDGRNNLAEFQAGTNPNYAEPLVASDGMSSRWINEGRDLAIPGRFVVTNLASGFRGLYENSNQGTGSSTPGVSGLGFPAVDNVSFQSPLFVVRTNDWDNNWLTNFSLQVEYSVGDNDGSCIYINYQNEFNWYRITYDGQATGGSLVNAIQGLSIQKRTNGYFSAITATLGGNQPGLYPDPVDFAGFTKRLKINVGGTNGNFQIYAIGWNTNLNSGLGDWDTNYSQIATFTDTDIPNGRIGFSSWAQGSFGFPTATNGNPVSSGWFCDNITLTNNGNLVFSEDWESVPLSAQLLTGWSNPYSNTAGLVGDWQVTPHQTLGNLNSTYGTLQSGTLGAPKTDGEGPLLIAPPLTNVNYVLEVGITPYDVGGMGFVFDYVDTNNYSRVLFDQRVPALGQFARGVNISKKSAGVWTDVVVGDSSFVYTPGRAFDVRFSSANGNYTMAAWNLDDPTNVFRWQWTNAPVASPSYGVSVWDMPDAHYRHVRAYNLNVPAPIVPTGPISITNITLQAGNVILSISKPPTANYHVLRATDVTGPYITNALNQSGNQYIEAQPTGSATYYYRLQLLQ